MSEVKLSIIMPLYNSEAVVNETIGRLITTIGGRNDVELILIDDGSIDKTKTICENYIKKYNASLKYYKIDYLPISDKLYYEYADELLKHIRELVELENGINFTGNAKIAIILTDEELANFIRNIDDFKKCKKIYLGHDVLTDGEQEQIFKDRKITINVIPDYYYRELEN